ncbi:hypothetical protein [Isoptericola croceus]|uniref:hypothetical protein n=1 Tax=Isoptericola croceus TaxID=3031406 RepID=UPI0023F6E1AE|nr:hypothetical protein [Isoptericola croceus]
MRVARLAVRALLTGALGAGLALTAALPATAGDDLDVTAAGVAFDGKKIEREDRDQRLRYSIRSLAGLDYNRLTESMDGARRGYVAFSAAPAEMPDGYCVTYVNVPGVGEWRESLLDQRCTEPGAGPTKAPAQNPKTSPTASARPTADPTPASTPTPSRPADEPSPTPTPEPTPTPSVSASPSPSASPTPSVSAATEAMGVEQFEALGRSFSNELPAIDERHQAAGSRVTDSKLWAMTGFGLAATGLGAGGVVVWRMRHRDR